MQTKRINLTDEQITAAWRAGNDAGHGEAVGAVNHSPREAAEDDEYDVVRTFDTGMTTSQAVIAWDGDNLIAICDSNGPWAVDITAANDAEAQL